jgi:hypothetical protein
MKERIFSKVESLLKVIFKHLENKFNFIKNKWKDNK